jgi:hypothetical protein
MFNMPLTGLPGRTEAQAAWRRKEKTGYGTRGHAAAEVSGSILSSHRLLPHRFSNPSGTARLLPVSRRLARLNAQLAVVEKIKSLPWGISLRRCCQVIKLRTDRTEETAWDR